MSFEELRARNKYFKLVIKDGDDDDGDDGGDGDDDDDDDDDNANELSSVHRKELNQAATSYSKINGRDYNIIHEQNTTFALNNMVSRARIKPRRTKSNDKIVLDHRESSIPKVLKRDYKRDIKVKVGCQEMVVKNKLGSGSYGTVILCFMPSLSPNNIAMKIQEQPSSLAWEYEVLDKIKSRVGNKMGGCDNTHSCGTTFPTALSFMIFRDGAAMGMTAGSCTGLNLIDIINAHKGSVPELLAIHYTSRMLKHLETLHTAANFLVR